MATKLSHKNAMEGQIVDTMCLSFKVKLSHELHPALDALYAKSKLEVERMLKDRSKKSTKDYTSLPSVVSKSLIKKYQANKKCKKVKSLVLPICGDKGKQVKIVDGGLRIQTDLSGLIGNPLNWRFQALNQPKSSGGAR